MHQELTYTLKQLSDLLHAELIGDENLIICGVGDISDAESDQLAFLDNEKYARFMKTSNAGAFIVSRGQATKFAHLNKNFLIVTEAPSSAFQKCLELFIPEVSSGFSGIHSTAVIHHTAILGKDVTIEPYVVIGQHACIGSHVHIGSGSIIGAYSKIDDFTLIYPKVVVRERVTIGKRVIIQAGAIIGSCGFGYITNLHGQHKHLKHLGQIIIEDDVEIGAGTTIDRGRFKNTVIRHGTKIDNQVQIAHNVEIGKHSMIVAQAGIAGSTKLGNHVIVGGQTGIAGHLSITDHVIMMAQTGVTKSIQSPGIYGGAPARPYQEIHRQVARIRNLPKTEERLSNLEKQVRSLSATILSVS